MTQKLIHIDDDEAFSSILARRLAHHHWQSETHTRVASALASKTNPKAILLDLNLGEASSLSSLSELRSRFPNSRIIILTGYASIATTVYAIKQGADDYLSKPVDLHHLLYRLQPKNLSEPDTPPQLAHTPLSPEALEWEQIQQTLAQQGGNISATARTLGMHRRTLQRKLQRKSPHR